MSDPNQLYQWRWRAYLPERHGQVFRVVAWGKADRVDPPDFPIGVVVLSDKPLRPMRNACTIEFGDGWRCTTSRQALRKAPPNAIARGMP